MAQFHWAYDYNDAVTPTIAQIVDYASYKTISANRPWTIKLFPKASQAIYTSQFSTGYAIAPKKTWLDIASSTIPHYAIKFGFDGTNWAAGQVRTYRFRPIYYMSFKGVK